jgi:hypothetical protein
MPKVADAEAFYINLLRTRAFEDFYVENEMRLVYLRSCLETSSPVDPDVFVNIRYQRPIAVSEDVRQRDTGIGNGRAMIGRKRSENIEFCLNKVIHEELRSDWSECGVRRRGAVIFMRGSVAANGLADRKVWAADSVCSFPEPSCGGEQDIDWIAERYPMLAINLGTECDLFRRYGSLDDQVCFLPGWFQVHSAHSAYGETGNLAAGWRSL